MGYRAGYSANERREIESNLFHGYLKGVVSTTALELGIDIGSLDAVIHLGFPYSVAGYFQQAGRAGRRGKEAITILIAENGDVMDRYYINNPKEIFQKPLEYSLIYPYHDIYLRKHIQCAANEIPIILENETYYFGEYQFLKKICDEELMRDEKKEKSVNYEEGKGEDKTTKSGEVIDLEKKEPAEDDIKKVNDEKEEEEEDKKETKVEDDMEKEKIEVNVKDMKEEPKETKEVIYYCHPRFKNRPERYFSIRNIEERDVHIIDANTRFELEAIETSRLRHYHEHAIFLFKGQSYKVIESDEERKLVLVVPVQVNYITRPANRKIVTINSVNKIIKVNDQLETKYGSVRIQTIIYGYYKLNPYTSKILSKEQLPNRSIFQNTYGFWIDSKYLFFFFNYIFFCFFF